MLWFLAKRSMPVYVILTALWIGIVAWEAIEHSHVRNANRQTLINRGRDITSTLGIVVRSQRRFGGFISQDRFEATLKDLIRPGDLDSVVVLSADGLPVAAAGVPVELSNEALSGPGVVWSDYSLTLMNLIDLGNAFDPDQGETAAIVMSPDSIPDRSSFRRRGERDRTNAPSQNRPPPPLTSGADTNATQRNNEFRGEGRFRPSSGRPPFGRPPWMDETEYQEVIQKRGVHSFLIVLSNDLMRSMNSRDLWMRLAIILFATAAAGVSAFAWRNLAQSSELQIRLVKASEMNTHLKKMNLSAAGLAHETRNPLNLIRGIAQMISQQKDTPADIRERSGAIIEEADRVTAQLNEFINYSKPREVQLSPVSFTRIANDIARALKMDAEEKDIQIETPRDEHTIEADDQMLRQVLFNLVMNAVQAVEKPGQIEIALLPGDGDQAMIEVRDEGPGVSAENRIEIFKPYFTMHQNGTGLGLSVVQQIVSAHGWEIQCLPNEPTGAIFRITHVKQVRPAARNS
jgi:signal transduction histidine kinase